MVTPTFAAHTDPVVAQIQLLLELPSPTPPTHVDPDPNPDLVGQPGARGSSIETLSAGHSPASNLEYTFRGLFEALSVSAVSNQALLDRLDRTVRIEAALRAEMALREKVEEERGQANTERDLLEERVRGLRTELRTCKRRAVNLSTYLEQALAEKELISDDLGFTQQRLSVQLAATMSENAGCGSYRQRWSKEKTKRWGHDGTPGLRPPSGPGGKAKKYKELATRVENAIQAQLSSKADQVRELDRQQRGGSRRGEERYRVEVAGHREASKALATATHRFPDVVLAFWDWVSAHFRVTSGSVFDRLLEAWVRDDPALFEDNCENLSSFAFPTRQPPSTRARGRIRGVSYDNLSVVLARDQRSQSLAVPTLPTPTSQSGAASYQGSPGPTRTMTLVTGASSGAADALVSTKSGSSMTPGTTGTESVDAVSSVSSTSGASEGASGAVQTTRTSGMASGPGSTSSSVPTNLPAAHVSTPSSKRPSPGTSTQLTKKARRSDPDAAGPLGASLPPPVDSAYASVVARSPWKRYSTTLVSFVPLSLHQLPEWRELDRALRSFWQKYAHSIWNRSFMTSSGAAEREVKALMGPLLGIAGSLFRVVQAYGVQLLRFLCYPHSYWPEFLREGVSLRNLITLHGGQAVADYVQTQGPEWWPVVPFLGRPKPFAPPFMSVLSWLHGRTLRAKLLNRFSPGNPAVCTRAAISSAIGWMIQEAISARDAGNVGGVYPFIVGSHSHPPVGSQWARGLRPPQGLTPGSLDPPLPVHQASLGIPTSPAPASAANPVVLDDSSEGSHTDAD
ncbi:hypothetical protein DYB31_014069 [Aphanomyces astaci]|uniref:Uncharacterized protein n=1 Tax=Aphanomyces astaci TaxID=112090 RepID=A0A397FX95_APHAT|nr:hypothetical protein DYB31_014069 [Aphanomyces astaci]